MKVLVVDDTPEKITDIVGLFEAIPGIAASSIVVCDSGIDAREKLSETMFDLLVLDIKLPLRKGEDPDRKGGMNLLTEITLSPRFKSPPHVVALTGFEDLRKEFNAKFNNGYWTIDLYDPSDIGWRDRLKARAKYVLKSCTQAAQTSYKTDLCIITALDVPELSAVRSLPWDWSPPRAFDQISFFHAGSYVSDGEKFSVAAAAAPRMGMVSAAIFAHKVIGSLRPRILAMAGVCAGIRGSCEMGDLLVADPSWDWQMGKYAQDAFEIAPDQIGSPVEITQCLSLLRQDRSFLFKTAEAFLGERPPNVPSILAGPVASGSAVLADDTTAETIKGQHRKLLGIDMELFGVYCASRDSSAPRPLTFGIKAVCDFADHRKDDKYQAFAAHMSAHVIGALAERYSKQLIRPQLPIVIPAA
jgi:nucleoside phosphorylase/CheY-like chemotaxis protein